MKAGVYQYLAQLSCENGINVNVKETNPIMTSNVNKNNEEERKVSMKM
jgi:hypothetical protein